MYGNITLRFTESEVELLIEALKDSRAFRSSQTHYTRCVVLADRLRHESAIDAAPQGAATGEAGGQP